MVRDLVSAHHGSIHYEPGGNAFVVTASGQALFYLGGPGGLATSPTTEIPIPVSGNGNRGLAASAGDVNGDGILDLYRVEL